MFCGPTGVGKTELAKVVVIEGFRKTTLFSLLKMNFFGHCTQKYCTIYKNIIFFSIKND